MVDIIRNFDMHISETGKQISFRRKGENIQNRAAICQVFIYQDVGVMYGIQGEDFFRALYEHLDELFSKTRMYMGYVWVKHAELYRNLLGLNVEEHHFFEIEGEKVVWVVVSKVNLSPIK